MRSIAINEHHLIAPPGSRYRLWRERLDDIFEPATAGVVRMLIRYACTLVQRYTIQTDLAISISGLFASLSSSVGPSASSPLVVTGIQKD